MKISNKLSKFKAKDFIEPNMNIPPLPKEDDENEDEVIECIAFSKMVDNDLILAKNRDRPYKPHVSIYRELYGDVELAFMKDEDTGWTEGLNSAGIGVINTALMVGRDEEEKKIAAFTGKKSKDGIRIKQAIKFTNIEDVVESLTSYMGGIKGHTIVSDGKVVYTIEATSKTETIIKKRDIEEPVVRTNHGHDHPDAGYQSGDDYISSVFRKEQMTNNVDTLDSLNRIFKSLSKSEFGKNNPNNTVRDTETMSTCSQMYMNLNKLEFHFRPLKNKCVLYGVYDFTPEGYEHKIKVFTYVDDNKVEHD